MRSSSSSQLTYVPLGIGTARRPPLMLTREHVLHVENIILYFNCTAVFSTSKCKMWMEKIVRARQKEGKC